jgi:hypothetical protein
VLFTGIAWQQLPPELGFDRRIGLAVPWTETGVFDPRGAGADPSSVDRGKSGSEHRLIRNGSSPLFKVIATSGNAPGISQGSRSSLALSRAGLSEA